MKIVRRLTSTSVAAVAIAAGLACSSTAQADQVIPDDLIVQGSQCIGFNCINNEAFGFSTLILKEDNTRIRFEDTSVGPGFPANKWQLTANDSASGGGNFFAIDDVTLSRTLFKVTAGARANSLVVDSNSNVGVGTASPSLLLHMLKSDTPAIRLEQDNTGGFTAQTWDIGANEANFFVRDLTGGSRLPFRIRPGAPTSSLDINSIGFVGIGTSSPTANLHVSSAASPAIQLQSTGATPSNWSISSAAANGVFGVKDVVSKTVPFKIVPGAPNNAFVIRANGSFQFANLVNCTNGIRTNAAGVVSCMPAVNSKAEVAGTAPGVTLANYNSSNTAARGGNGNGSSARASEAQETQAGCSDGDIAGSWSMFGTNIEEAGANSVLWCDVQFSKTGKAPAKYSMEGTCRSHATNTATPQSYVVSGDRSISVTSACKFSGNFSIKQGNKTAVTATILEGRIEGTGDAKTRAVGVSRWPRGKTFALQTFTMQR